MATDGRGTGDPTATLHPDIVEVQPGASASVEVRVRGQQATDSLRFEVLGGVAEWSFVVPAAGSPEACARVVLRPPRATEPPAGPVPVSVRVWSEGGAETVALGTVVVAPFVELSASLEPRVATGRSVAHHELTVENRGNVGASLAFEVVEGKALSVHVREGALRVVAGEQAKTAIVVRPDKRVVRGAVRPHAFRLVVRPEIGTPVTVAGEMRQQPLLTGRATIASVAVTLLALLAVTIATRPSSPGPDPGAEVSATDGPGDAPASDCPASGHVDTFVSGLTPERIPSLPTSYSFSFVKEDRCSPVRFDPCQPIHYVVNPAQATPTGVADVEEGFTRLARATGMTFVNDGVTDEVARRGPYVADRYPGRWAPILVVWNRQSGDRANVEVVGSGFPYAVQDVLVSGVLSLNSDAVVDRARNTPVPGGFGTAPGFGPVGAEGVTWGRVILHELAHIVGLGHTRDRDQLMYPDTAEQTSHTTEYRSGDREGLRILGRASGCLPSTPAPGPPPARP